MPNPRHPAFPTYSVTQKHAVLSVPSDGAPTGRTLALRKVDAVGQYHSNMRSSTALPQSHDTTRGVGCPILATQPSPPTQSPKNTQCSACPPMGPQWGAPWHSEKWMLWASIIATCGLLRHSHSLMTPPKVWDAQSSPPSLPHLLSHPKTHSPVTY